jgi:hypothetical protein
MLMRNDNLLFVQDLMGAGTPGMQIFLDVSHLTTTPRDVAKMLLSNIREGLSKPYPIILFVFLVFLVAYRYSATVGGTVGS